MYISDPYSNLKDEEGKKKKPGFMTKLFRTHPLTEDRVKELRGL
jgi:Zn-dependent protease with chaperone function